MEDQRSASQNPKREVNMDNTPAPGPAPQSKEIQVPCPKCKVQFKYTMPEPEIMNLEKFSQVVWVHENPIECPGCKAQYVLTVGNLNVGFGMAVRKNQEPTQEKSRILIPPPGMKVPTR